MRKITPGFPSLRNTSIDLLTLKDWIWSLIRASLIIGIAYVILFPLLSKIPSSFMVERDLYDLTVRWIPRNITFDNYRVAFEHMRYPEAFFNSFLLTIMVSTLQLISCTFIGYGLARFKSRENNILFGLVIFTLIVPPQMIMIPLYLNFRFFDLFGLLQTPGLNLTGSYWPFILMSVTGTGLRNGLFIYILRQYFRGMPRDLEEAAYVDGAGLMRTFFFVMVPGAIPALIVVFLFAFVWQWNDYFYISMFLGGRRFLPFMLEGLAMRVQPDAYHVGEGISNTYASLINNTGMLLFIAPLLILYIFMQRYFTESVERTGLIG